VAAVGSFVDARSRGGRWLVRMEDLDVARVIPGSADEILRTLEAFGLWWDGEVVYQSRRLDQYQAALETLRVRGLTFECSCSRRELATEQASEQAAGTTPAPYPGTCRSGPSRPGPTATRLRIAENTRVLWDDAIQGHCCVDLRTLGDVVIRRRDGVFAYQLAVVVDDAAQGVSVIIRGCDLLESTAWQMELQKALALPGVRYGHLPVVVEPIGQKLAKSRRSVPLEPVRAAEQLTLALSLLGHEPPADIRRDSPRAVLDWACTRWNLDRFHAIRQVTAPA
jgi:glutamyl-Q tRNA(Asp) synthetase